MNAFGTKTFDPKEAILHRIRFYSLRSNPCIADTATIQFLKEKAIPNHQMNYITFQDVEGRRWYFTYFLKKRIDGSWHIISSTGGYDVKPTEKRQSTSILLRIGENSFREFLTGGEITDNNFNVARVRLISPNEHVLEDIVQDGLVLFWTDKEVFLPLQAELYNASGEIIGRHMVLNEPTYGI